MQLNFNKSGNDTDAIKNHTTLGVLEIGHKNFPETQYPKWAELQLNADIMSHV